MLYVIDAAKGLVCWRSSLMGDIMQVVKLVSFAPFKNAAHALDEVNAISEAVLTDDLKNFLEVNLPKVRITQVCPCTSEQPYSYASPL